MIHNLFFGVVYLYITFRFSGIFSKPTKNSNKDLSYNDSFCWSSGLGNYFACKRFVVLSNPHVVTGSGDPTKSQAQRQHNTVSLKKLHLKNLTSVNIMKKTLHQHS